MAIGTPFDVQGYFFEPNSPVTITVDGRAAGQGQTSTDGRGQFTIALTAPPAIGPHTISVRQQVRGGPLGAAIGFTVNNTDGVERPGRETVAAPVVDQPRPTLPPPAKSAPPPSAPVSLPRLIVASELQPGATASAGILRLAALPDERGPAGSSLEWTNVTPDAQLTMRVDAGITGTVDLYASFRRGPDSASVQVLVNGRRVGDTIALAAPVTTTGKFLIGPVTLGTGPTTVTLVVMPSGAGGPQRVSLLALSLEK